MCRLRWPSGRGKRSIRMGFCGPVFWRARASPTFPITIALFDMKDAAPAFDCRRCGECCQGRGGVRLNEEEAGLAAAVLGISIKELKRRYLADGSPPWDILCGEDGFCLFSQRDGTCRIHQAKPAVCRAWPYLAGPLKVESAFQEAKSACPGLRRDLGWDEFKEAAQKRHQS
ncbi:hypothetical protein C4J81_01080 [Deltaproteobacteria bacterium Smac51]|nr:hypothetical protein C4J81_01080 [Deltaproteobacteria bacterium Smac51]